MYIKIHMLLEQILDLNFSLNFALKNNEKEI